MDPNEIVVLLEVLIAGAAKLLAAQKNRTAQNVGADIDLANEVALSVLQAVARVKGASVDWTNPMQVSAFVASLPMFIPISDPTPPTGAPIKP